MKFMKWIIPLLLWCVSANAQILVPLFSPESATGVTTEGPARPTNNDPHVVVARAVDATTWTGVTVTVYGANTDCGATCEASDGKIIGTITDDGGTLDVSKVFRYDFIFALVTSHTAGTIQADFVPIEFISLFGAGADDVRNVAFYGADNTGTIDSLEAFDDAEAATPAEGVIFVPPGDYTLTGTWVIPSNKSIYFMPGVRLLAPQGSFGNEAVIHYDGTGLTACPRCGITGYPDIENSSGLNPITDTDYVAVLIENTSSRQFEFGRLTGFYSGIRLFADTGIVGFNRIHAGNMNGMVYNIDLVADATGLNPGLTQTGSQHWAN